jgi:2-polyprenyl-6-methoxyphenol hydroxylase-like FAD-dependent oxidoreductase
MNGTAPHRTVIVVGSGPTGLLLAGDLATAGVTVTLVEKRPRKISNLSRAFGVHARTLEQLDARGLADELLTTGDTITGLRLFRRLSLDLSTLPSRFPFLLITPQYEVERLLERRAREAGVEFAYESEVVGLRQDDEGVDLDVRGADGAVVTRRAAYVVGADGHRSAVREAIGLDFPGVSVIKSLILADVRLAEKPEGVLTVNGRGDAFAMIASFGDGWYRVMGWNRRNEVSDDAPLDPDEVKEITRRALGTDYGMHDARWLSRFHSDERQAPHYRVGRVFLAGDAAHIHSPAGGQGMNTGLQDAANLSWKLAAAIQGRAPEGSSTATKPSATPSAGRCCAAVADWSDWPARGIRCCVPPAPSSPRSSTWPRQSSARPWVRSPGSATPTPPPAAPTASLAPASPTSP